VAEDGEIVQQIDFPATTKGAIAQRLAKIAMMQARSAVPISLPCNLAAFQWQLFDVVTVDIPEIGADGAYLITSYTYQPSGGIDMVLVQHLATDFAWTSATDEAIVEELATPSFNSVPPEIQNLVVSGAPVYNGDSYSIGLSATWTNNEWAFLKHYEVQYKLSADTEWGNGTTVTTTSWSVFGPVSIGVEYDVRVRSVGEDDRTSAWTVETNITPEADSTPPGVPTILSVTHPGSGTHPDTISWTNPGDLDFSRARVYFSLTNDPGTSVEFAEVFGFPLTAYSVEHAHDAGGTYYWVTSVDRTGNESAKTYAGTA
jgi:predicted phage tail protein